MELKERLRIISELIPRGTILCDIGTDHAFIPIYAVENEICSKAVAADVRAGPVRTATRNVGKHKLEGKIDVRLGGGLQPIRNNELGTVIIAGMGGPMIIEILQESFEKAKKAEYIILQPMNAIELVRSFLYENGFDIVDERLAVEEKKVYNIICAKWSGNIKNTDEFDCYIGNRLLESNDEKLPDYLEKRLKLLNTAITGMEKAIEKPEILDVYKSIKSRVAELIKNRFTRLY